MSAKTLMRTRSTLTHTTVTYIYVAAALCLMLAARLPQARAEAIHMTRDFGYHSNDQEMETTHKSAPIENDQDAAKFLQHYGYLKCNDTEKQDRKRRSISDFPLTEGGAGSTNAVIEGCTKLDIIHAVVMYQDLLKLPITGSIDVATKEQMNKGRCGDNDFSLVEVEEKRLSGEEPRPNSSGYVAPWMTYDGEYRQMEEGGQDDDRENHRRRRSSSSSHKQSYRHPPLEEYTDEHGTTWGREPGQIHLKHHHPVPEGSLDEHHTVLRRVLMPNQFSLSHKRRQMLKEIQRQYELNSNTTRRNESNFDARTLIGKPFVNISPAKKRRKRHDVEKRSSAAGSAITKFNQNVLVYKLLDGSYSQRIPIVEQCTTLSLAFRMWAEVTNIDFQPAGDDTPADEIHIALAFGSNQHLDCIHPFDGQGGDMAHTIKANGNGEVHFDNEENWKSDPLPGSNQIPFLLAAVHEIGHVLGVGHIDDNKSVMYPTLQSIQDRILSSELTRFDRQAIQTLYGQCTGRFDGAFDWLHTNPHRHTGLSCMEPCACEEQVWQYFSYFFRSKSYWLYLNSQGRPRYGDPLPIKQEWKGLPPRVDGMTQIMVEHTNLCEGLKQTTQFEFTTLFFKDDMVYMYDDVNDEVTSSMKISEKYPSRDNWESIPNNINAVIFDPRNNHLFFFKNEWVWEVDPTEANASCCVTRHRFDYLYPSSEITGHVDAGYLRWGEKQVYFYQGNKAYIAELWQIKTVRGYQVRAWQDDVAPAPLTKIGAWNDRWKDICDVVTSTYTDCFDL